MWSPRSTLKHASDAPPVPAALAAQLAAEYSDLTHSGQCPRGVYVIPTSESIQKWQGVLFLHKGPYAGSVLRFVVEFPAAYPRIGPIITFESEVYHPLIEPKSRIYRPTGRIAQWQPGIHTVAHVLHDLKRAFKTTTLDALTEHESANKQIWSLYNHSHQTFLSMTHQRAISSNTTSALYPDIEPTAAPGSASSSRPSSPAASMPAGTMPRTPSHRRQLSTASSVGSPGSTVGMGGKKAPDPGLIRFRPLVKGEEESLRKKIGI